MRVDESVVARVDGKQVVIAQIKMMVVLRPPASEAAPSVRPRRNTGARRRGQSLLPVVAKEAMK
jgi:hypothetical protein